MTHLFMLEGCYLVSVYAFVLLGCPTCYIATTVVNLQFWVVG